MKDIKELFKKTYGFEPINDEQLDLFIDYLDKRLSYREKLYIFNEYGVDLLGAEDIEKHIIVSMKHPLIKKKINPPISWQ